jgi:hypothetical protein
MRARPLSGRRRGADVLRMTFRTILALAAAAALALPAAALAEDGPSPSSGKPAPCAAPRHEGQPATCAVRICADGQASTPEAPCLAPCAPGVRPTREAPCAPVPGAFAPPTAEDRPAAGQQQPQQPRQGDEPKRGGNAFGVIKSRVWRVAGEADGFDADRHALSIVVDKVAGLAPRLAARLQEALGDQADVLVGPRTRVLGADGKRIAAGDVAAALDAADSVVVTGKLAPPRTWAKDEDGTPVPALRALRVKIAA